MGVGPSEWRGGACVYVVAKTHVCTCLQRPEVNLWVVSREPSTLFSKTRSLMGAHLLDQASQPVSLRDPFTEL